MINRSALRRALVVGFLLLLVGGSAAAQEEAALRLSLSRDAGFGLGGRIQGAFSYRVDGPDNLERVVFLLDGEIIGEDDAPPFRLSFRTESFAVGSHTLSAVGYTDDGRELASNHIQRQFVSSADSRRVTLWIIIPILVLVVGGRLLTAWITNRGRSSGQPSLTGPLGSAVCPKCGRPFAMHIWGLNVIVGKFDRCPHCGRWSLVRRAHPNVLQRAIEAMAASEDETAAVPPQNSDEQLHQQLDDSRFDNFGA